MKATQASRFRSIFGNAAASARPLTMASPGRFHLLPSSLKWGRVWARVQIFFATLSRGTEEVLEGNNSGAGWRTVKAIVEVVNIPPRFHQSHGAFAWQRQVFCNAPFALEGPIQRRPLAQIDCHHSP